MYSITTLCENIDNGTITVETNGHKIRGGAAGVIARLKEKLNWYVEYYTEILGPNEKYKRDEQSIGFTRRNMDDLNSDKAFVVGQMTYPANSEEYCQTCGERLYTYLESPTVIRLGKHLGSHTDHTITPVECIFKNGIPAHVNTISVPTGNLLIANHFGEFFQDCTEEDKYTDPWSINYQRGRNNCADYLAKSNVGYMQCGNQSVHIYQSKTNSEELVLMEWEIDMVEENIEYYREELAKGVDTEKWTLALAESEATMLEYLDYNYVGSISCGVWRIMLADQQFLDEVNYVKDEYVDVVPVTVPAGDYEITNFFFSDVKSPFMMRIVRVHK
jgi:hypothetical protein